MKRILSLFIVTLFSTASFAQKSDSLYVGTQEGEWVMSYKPKKNETIFQVSQRFHVPTAVLADANGLTYQEDITGNKKVVVPVGEYNRLSSAPLNSRDGVPLYYKTQAHDNLNRIARSSHVSQSVLVQWNELSGNSISANQILLVGWVRCDACQGVKSEQNVKPSTTVTKQPVVETIKSKNKGETVQLIPVKKKIDTLSKMPEPQRTYTKQTDNGKNVTTEKGSVAFFNMGAGNDTVYYAFHNVTPKGTIIKVYIPGTDKTVYVKVLGPVPATKQYYNCIIAISSNAKTTLNISDSKGWAELTYVEQQ
ncbi:MAG: LysM peptidoglycan-binding domain-containing protein [Bacteroidota bacterium]